MNPKRRAYQGGERVGAWTVKSFARAGYYHCVCDCGTERIVDVQSLRSKRTQSCGCKKIENCLRTKGLSEKKPERHQHREKFE